MQCCAWWLAPQVSLRPTNEGEELIQAAPYTCPMYRLRSLCFCTAWVFAASVSVQAQWEVEQSHSTSDLHGIHSVNPQIAWASGNHGTVLRTVDGGNTWTPCAVPPEGDSLDFRGVQGFDASTAVVMSTGKGELSRVYKTTDGCKSWTMTMQNPDPEGSWDSMQFQYRPAKAATEKGYFAYGVLVGHPVDGEFVLFTSKDHGSSWQSLREDEAFSPGPAAIARPGEYPFAMSNTALTAVASDESFAFVTGGEAGARLLTPLGQRYDFSYASMKYTFSSLDLPMPAGLSAGAVSIASRRTTPDRVDLMIVGGDPAQQEVGSAVFVRHGGPTLNVKKLIAPRAVAAEQPPHGFRSAVAYDAATNSWITVGPNGTDVSHDDGRTWIALGGTNRDAADASMRWQALSLPFAVGPEGRIGKLHDTGSGVTSGR